MKVAASSGRIVRRRMVFCSGPVWMDLWDVCWKLLNSCLLYCIVVVKESMCESD